MAAPTTAAGGAVRKRPTAPPPGAPRGGGSRGTGGKGEGALRHAATPSATLRHAPPLTRQSNEAARLARYAAWNVHPTLPGRFRRYPVASARFLSRPQIPSPRAQALCSAKDKHVNYTLIVCVADKKAERASDLTLNVVRLTSTLFLRRSTY